MKKIALCSLLVCLGLINASYAVNTCKKDKIYDGSNATSDEYLFPSENEYLIATHRANVYECDKIRSTSCTDKEIITLPAGHYFEGKQVDEETTYKCDAWTVGDDAWKKYTPGADEVNNTCDTAKIYDGSNAKSDEYLFTDKLNFTRADGATAKVYECDKIATDSCQDAEYITMAPGHYFKGQRIDKETTYKCDALTIGNDKWVPVTDGEQKCPEGQVWNSTTNKCEAKKGSTCEQYKQYKERYACCIMGNKTTWSGEPANGKCTCVDTNTEWKFDGTKGVCKQKENVVPTPTPTVQPEEQCYYTFNGQVICENGNMYSITKKIPLKQEDCSKFSNLVGEDRAILDKYKQDLCADNSKVLVMNSQKIKDAMKTVDDFKKSASNEASVWRDADGNFNGARLASDLTAGVVLGTVGGVVSGVVIKKKQLEKGYDALHCTVGGQTVADWGDEFRVGLQR